MEGRLSPGQFTAFFAYLQMLIWPMIGAGFTFNLLQRASASMGRINAILARQPDITSPPAPVRAPDPRRPVLPGPELRSRGVLADLSFELPAGARLGILGRTGSGKSTLVRLIPRLIDPPPGTLFLDGVDVRDYDLQHLRRSVAMVPQDPFLFSVAIRENIAFGLSDGAGFSDGDGGAARRA